MDQLFIELIKTHAKFLKLISTAEQHLTDETIEKGGVNKNYLIGWHEFVQTYQDAQKDIETLFQQEPINKEQLNRHLIPFRILPRFFSERMCTWSTDYDAVKDLLPKVTAIAREIKIKYHLGEGEYEP